MNKKIYLLPLLVIALLLQGCTEIDQTDVGGLVPISLTAVVEDDANAGTRAATTLLNSFSNEELGINLTNCVSSDGVALSTTTYTVGGTFASQPYILAGQTATVKGYYPSSAASTTSFSVQDNQISDNNYKASDLMFAASQNATKASPSPTLSFIHKMAKLIVNVTPTGGVTSITSVTLNNIKRTVGFTSSTGELGELSSSGDITMSNEGAALIPPQTTDANNTFLTIVTDAGTAYYKVGKTFAGGSVYTLNINISQTDIGLSTTITGWDGNESSVTVNPNAIPTTLEAVDLGLPSGLKWANMNVGASTPTDYGSYYPWGEVIGCNVHNGQRIRTGWGTYNYGTDHSLTKYCWDSSYGYNGFTDELTTLDLSDDAAYVNMGDTWRMPTKDEFAELLENTTKTFTSNYMNTGTAGLILTSTVPGYTDKSIFFPTPGWYHELAFNAQEIRGLYYSSSLDTRADGNPSNAWYFNFYTDTQSFGTYAHQRMHACSVRAVQPETICVPLSRAAVGMIICSDGNAYSPSATIPNNVTKIAMVAYVGKAGSVDASGNWHGLAIALKDANNMENVPWCSQNTAVCSSSQVETNADAIADLNGYAKTMALVNHSHTHSAAIAATSYQSVAAAPANTSGWFLPTSGQWNLMVKGMSGCSNSDLPSYPGSSGLNYNRFNRRFDAAGLDNTEGDPYIRTNTYWTSTERKKDEAWHYNATHGHTTNNAKKMDSFYVRAVFAF